MNSTFYFEIKSWLKSPILYIISIGFIGFTLVSFLGTAGYFDGNLNNGATHSKINSSYNLIMNNFFTLKCFLLLIAIVGGQTIYRDFSSDSYKFLYAYPINKRSYLLGKLGSALFIISLLVFILVCFMKIGEWILGSENPRILYGAFQNYITCLVYYLIPSSIIICNFVFIGVALTRNILSAFLVVIVFVLFQYIVQNLFFRHETLLAILDPFGQYATEIATKNWGYDTKNSLVSPVNNLVILNRITWFSLSGLLYIWFNYKFKLGINNVYFSIKKNKNVKLTTTKTDTQSKDNLIITIIPEKWHTTIWLSIYYLKRIAKSKIYIILNVLALASVFFLILRVTQTGDMVLVPSTRILLTAPLSIFNILIILIGFLSMGQLMRMDQKNNIDQILAATQVTENSILVSRFGAIALSQLIQYIGFIMLCIGYQILNGHFNIQLHLYFFQVLFLSFLISTCWNLTSLFCYSLIPNLFLGLFILLAIWLGAQSIESMGIQSKLLYWNTVSFPSYSDCSGLGFGIKATLLLIAYWLFFGLVLLWMSLKIWNRFDHISLYERAQNFKNRINYRSLIILLLFVSCFSFLGFKIYIEEKLSIQQSSFYKDKAYLKKYKEEWDFCKDLVLANISEIELDINLFPKSNAFTVQGKYTMVNESMYKIDTIYIRTGFDEISKIKLNQNARSILQDSFMKSHVFVLENSLLPNDSLTLEFEIQNTPNQLFTRNSSILSNGTYLKGDILPRMDYPFQEEEIALKQSGDHKHNYFNKDASNITLKTRITTDIDQVAIAPGTLTHQSSVNQRASYLYQSKNQNKFNFSFHSFNYKSSVRQYKSKNFEIYHAPNHNYNVEAMLDGLIASYDYCTERFGTYPYETVRIIEFPHTEDGYSATLMANNIPTSEILFNISQKDSNQKINLPFYVMAHELTHEWFGNQMMPANLEGSRMLTESIAEYLSLQIFKEHFGDQKADEFLNIQKTRYDQGRKQEQKEERPLYKVLKHQQYIAYGKGAIAFDQIGARIGYEKLDEILAKFLKAYPASQGLYPSTLDLIAMLLDETTASDHAYIKRLLMEI